MERTQNYISIRIIYILRQKATKKMIRRDYRATDELIKNAYLEMIKERNRMPTQTEVADRCHLARQTVNVHLNKINLKETTQPFKVFGNHVLMGLAKKAMNGDAQAAKLFFMLVYEWSEKTDIKLPDSIKLEYVPAKYTETKDEDD